MKTDLRFISSSDNGVAIHDNYRDWFWAEKTILIKLWKQRM